MEYTVIKTGTYVPSAPTKNTRQYPVTTLVRAGMVSPSMVRFMVERGYWPKEYLDLLPKEEE